MNVHDSEKIAGIFHETGYGAAEDSGDADVIVLNTCSIRAKAEQKFTSELGRLKKVKKKNPKLKIAVAGCIAQQSGKELLKRFPYIDFLFGPDNIGSLNKLIEGGNGRTAIEHNPDYHTSIIPMKREGGLKAWVSIMYGCNNFCAYCIVPYTRGRERSRPASDIYDEIKSLAAEGFKEITLLGQNVNSYGKNMPDNIDFPDLLHKIHDIDGLQRIRFVTSHPRDFSEKLIRAVKDLSKVCEHLHLPIQAGSDSVLKLMNRGYAYQEYKDKIDMLRSEIPHVAISTDIIVGFPGETDDDFDMTIRALSEIEYDGIYAFKYSKRPGTDALSLPDHIAEDVKSSRLAEIQELQGSICYRKNRMLEGKIVEVLVDGTSETDSSVMTGRTRSNKVVNFQGDASDTGQALFIKIVEAKMHSLNGEKV
jgi:tRNA-2-methylthio-N6-dimethylallyladenosine synthase